MSKRSPESISMNRIRLVEVGCIILTLLFTSFFSYKYLIQPNIDPNHNRQKDRSFTMRLSHTQLKEQLSIEMAMPS
ncbi:MAG: hypothetical protein SPI63_08835 [Bulleidia sp.]|nr:hypothetical protein [Bulleidia sp.]